MLTLRENLIESHANASHHVTFQYDRDVQCNLFLLAWICCPSLNGYPGGCYQLNCKVAKGCQLIADSSSRTKTSDHLKVIKQITKWYSNRNCQFGVQTRLLGGFLLETGNLGPNYIVLRIFSHVLESFSSSLLKKRKSVTHFNWCDKQVKTKLRRQSNKFIGRPESRALQSDGVVCLKIAKFRP